MTSQFNVATQLLYIHPFNFYSFSMWDLNSQHSLSSATTWLKECLPNLLQCWATRRCVCLQTSGSRCSYLNMRGVCYPTLVWDKIFELYIKLRQTSSPGARFWGRVRPDSFSLHSFQLFILNFHLLQGKIITHYDTYH